MNGVLMVANTYRLSGFCFLLLMFTMQSSRGVDLRFDYLQSDRMRRVSDDSSSPPSVRDVLHDACGNIAEVFGDFSVVYDAESRPAEIRIDGNTLSCRYNGFGDRLFKGVSGNQKCHMLDYGAGLRHSLQEESFDNIIQRDIYGSQGLSHRIDEDGGVHYFHTDEQGNVLALSNGQGDITGQYRYDVHGKVVEKTGDTDNAYLFGGGLGVTCEDEQHGLYHMKARYYSARLKRFLSRDPMGLAGGNNLYVYANNNPFMFVDPGGLCAEDFAFGSSSVFGFDWVNHILGDVMSPFDILFGSPAYGQVNGGGGGDPQGPYNYLDDRREGGGLLTGIGDVYQSISKMKNAVKNPGWILSLFKNFGSTIAENTMDYAVESFMGNGVSVDMSFAKLNDQMSVSETRAWLNEVLPANDMNLLDEIASNHGIDKDIMRFVVINELADINKYDRYQQLPLPSKYKAVTGLFLGEVRDPTVGSFGVAQISVDTALQHNLVDVPSAVSWSPTLTREYVKYQLVHNREVAFNAMAKEIKIIEENMAANPDSAWARDWGKAINGSKSSADQLVYKIGAVVGAYNSYSVLGAQQSGIKVQRMFGDYIINPDSKSEFEKSADGTIQREDGSFYYQDAVTHAINAMALYEKFKAKKIMDDYK